MAENPLNELGELQRRIMEILWQIEPASVQDVLRELNTDPERHSLAYTTVLTTMQRLEKAGWLTHERTEASGTAYQYRSTRKRNEAVGDSIRSLADNLLAGKKTLLFQHLLEDTGLTKQELDEIRKMIARRKET